MSVRLILKESPINRLQPHGASRSFWRFKWKKRFWRQFKVLSPQTSVLRPHAKLIQSLSRPWRPSTSAIDACGRVAWDFLIKPVGKSTLQKRIGEGSASIQKKILKRHLKAKQNKVALAGEQSNPVSSAAKQGKNPGGPSDLAFEGFCGRSAGHVWALITN